MRLNNASKFKPFYDNQSPWQRISGYQATATAIQNPFTLYYVGTNDWSSSHSYQFWNKNFTSAVGVNNDATLKTIYSPSPSGFVEPKTAAFTGFTSTGGDATSYNLYNVSGSFNKGWNFYTNGWKTGDTFFFPALGYRETWGSYTGHIDYVGEENLCVTAGAKSASHGYMFFFRLGRILPDDGDPRSRAVLNWPVKE